MRTTLGNVAATLSCLLLVGLGASAQEPASDAAEAPRGGAWTRSLKGRSERGALHDAYQRVRGDSGKWNDEPSLQHAPPVGKKPAGMSLDDWFDLLRRTRRLPTTSQDDNWLLFKTRQLDDNDRLWIERIERDGDQFTVVLNEAIWQGRYQKTFTYYGVFGVNLGRLEPGEYRVKWVVRPLAFRQFEGNGRPQEDQRTENWPRDEQPVEREPVVLSTTFSVVGGER